MSAARPLADRLGAGRAECEEPYERAHVSEPLPGVASVAVQRGPEADDGRDEVGMPHGEAQRDHAAEGVRCRHGGSPTGHLDQARSDSVGVVVGAVARRRLRGVTEAEEIGGHEQTVLGEVVERRSPEPAGTSQSVQPAPVARRRAHER